MIEEGLSYCNGSTIGEGEGKVNKRRNEGTNPWNWNWHVRPPYRLRIDEILLLKILEWFVAEQCRVVRPLSSKAKR